MNAKSKPTEEARKELPVKAVGKKPWVDPEITWHKALKEITLGGYCVDTCSPRSTPLVE